MLTVEPTVTQTVALVTKATKSNIKKLKTYLSKDGTNRQSTNKESK
jgi:hypothetical protein